MGNKIGGLQNVLFEFHALELLSVQDDTKDKLTFVAEQAITYTGDNITTVVTYKQTELSDTITSRYAYDNNKNPYYGLNFNFMNLKGYSRNNQVSQTISSSTTSRIFTYSYVYDKHHYPIIISERESKAKEAVNTYIEYIK
jgi:hypothetical protein